MHKDRMAQIGKHALPPEGTKEREEVLKRLSDFDQNPQVREKVIKEFKKAVAFSEIQAQNGAGLPADTLIREFNTTYNNRVFDYSLNDLPSSFNVVEAFNTFLIPSATFKVNPEIDCIFSFADFLDFVTSEDAPENTETVCETMEEGVIYSFNSIDDPEDYLFSTNDGDEFGISSVSLIRHEKEVSVILLAGQLCDLDEKTKLLLTTMAESEHVFYNNIKPDSSLKIEAPPLIKGRNLWRTIVLVRLDLNTSTIDARYVLQDEGQSYTITTDDLNSYTNMKGNFVHKDFEALLKDGELRILKYESLFELCKLAIYLPIFRNEFEDVISIERHPTIYGENRNKPKYQKLNKLVDSCYKIAFRDVEKITPSNRKSPNYREFFAPDLKIDTSGFWKNLDFQSIGVDKNNQPTHGRTWVTKTLSWRESSNKNTTLKVKTASPNKTGENHGFIYVMRSAVHDKNVFKVGLTRRDSETRSKELSRSTSSPDHFHVMEEWEVSDCVLAEKLIHEKLSEYRINPNREFFQVSYKTIFKVIDEVIEFVDGKL